MGVKVLEFANSIPDIVANMAAQTLTNLVNYGIRQVTDPIDKAITDARNQPSIRLLERLGFLRTGTEAASFKGAPCREHTYELQNPS